MATPSESMRSVIALLEGTTTEAQRPTRQGLQQRQALQHLRRAGVDLEQLWSMPGLLRARAEQWSNHDHALVLEFDAHGTRCGGTELQRIIVKVLPREEDGEVRVTPRAPLNAHDDAIGWGTYQTEAGDPAGSELDVGYAPKVVARVIDPGLGLGSIHYQDWDYDGNPWFTADVKPGSLLAKIAENQEWVVMVVQARGP